MAASLKLREQTPLPHKNVRHTPSAKHDVPSTEMTMGSMSAKTSAWLASAFHTRSNRNDFQASERLRDCGRKIKSFRRGIIVKSHAERCIFAIEN
jgi:hypothetical protein